MNLAEYRVLAVLMPLTLLVAIAHPLAGWWGTITGWLTALPVTVIALNVLPFLLGMKSRQLQWLVSFLASVAWAVFHLRSSGVTGFLAWFWAGVAVIDGVAVGVLAWRSSMLWQGGGGIAWRVFLLVALHAGAGAVGWKFGWVWGLTCGAVVAALVCRAILDPGCQWLGIVYRTTTEDEILITIDDGPDAHDTPLLLDLLDKHHTKAIFFMIGEKVRAHPELAREVVRRGHEIGNHTLTHPQGSFWCAGPWRTRREIAACQQVIEEATGKKPRLFRAPVGHRNLFTHPVCATLGLDVMGWNRRGYDAVEKDAEKVLGRILPEMSRRDIVLLHEATPIAEEVVGRVLEKADLVR
jgi:peptidoglycan/xylan/chitin deacetylase (PgdA/CDA1 family)